MEKIVIIISIVAITFLIVCTGIAIYDSGRLSNFLKECESRGGFASQVTTGFTLKTYCVEKK